MTAGGTQLQAKRGAWPDVRITRAEGPGQEGIENSGGRLMFRQLVKSV